VEGGEASAPSAPSTTNGGYAQATPPTDPPPPPVTVNATPGAYPDKVFINWSASEGAESYELWRTTGANDPANATRIGQSITATQRFDANVVPGTVYHYFVKAVAAGQAGAFSAPSATNSGYAEAAPVDPPDPPQWVFAGLGTFPDKVYVSWTASEGADHYEVWRRTGTNTSQGAVRVAPNRVARNFTDTNVVPGTFYYYFVKAVRDGDAGPLSPPMGTNGGYAQVLPPPDPPEPPANVYASLGTFSDHVYVFWTSVPEADSYEIWRKQGQNNPTSAQYLGTVSEGTVYNDYAVTGGTTYYYFVKTVNDEGTSGFSQPSPYNGGNVQ
jgi:predicted phage tail protein